MDSIENLIRIFSFDKLAELKKYCRTATIIRRDFANFVLFCKSSEGIFAHVATHRNFVPTHLALSEKDLTAFVANGVGRLKPGAQKAVNKSFAMLDERRMLSGHMFLNEEQWHFFYFDNHDQSEHRNHWVGGPHIHLINHLSTNRSAESVWSEFCDGNPNMKGALHIRFDRTP